MENREDWPPFLFGAQILVRNIRAFAHHCAPKPLRGLQVFL